METTFKVHLKMELNRDMEDLNTFKVGNKLLNIMMVNGKVNLKNHNFSHKN